MFWKNQDAQTGHFITLYQRYIFIVFWKYQDGRTGHLIALYQRYIFIVFWKNQDGRIGHFNNILSTLFTSPNGMSSLRAMYRFMILYSLVSMMLNTDLISWYIHWGCQYQYYGHDWRISVLMGLHGRNGMALYLHQPMQSVSIPNEAVHLIPAYGNDPINVFWKSLSVTCGRSVVFSGCSGFLHN